VAEHLCELAWLGLVYAEQFRTLGVETSQMPLRFFDLYFQFLNFSFYVSHRGHGASILVRIVLRVGVAVNVSSYSAEGTGCPV
jgi:hypothetical protein